MKRLAIAISHPIQYHAPLYAYLAKDGRFDLKVFYMTDRGARAYYEKLAKTMVKFDNPILDGYDYEFLRQGEPKNWWERKAETIHPRLVRRLLDHTPHAVYFHGYTNPSFWPAIRMCRQNGIKVLLRGENEDLLPRSTWRNFMREAFLKILLPNVDAILYIGKYNKEFFMKRGWPENKLFHVPYSVDSTYFRGGYSKEQISQIRLKITEKYNLSPETRLFIYTHKFRETMRPLDAVQAFCDALPTIRNSVALLMCGDGELRGEMEQIIQAQGQGKVVLTGFLSQNNLKEHLLASDIMVNPAIEPWGCSINEGLASELAMISSDLVAGWPDMVKAGENGYTYPCGDLQELAGRIRELSDMPLSQLESMKSKSFNLSEDLGFATCAAGLAAAMKS
jgi:glycosyltransferase involved in cell wall biosynthesis